MLFRYFPETDTLYIECRPWQAAETVEVSDTVLVDLDREGHIIGIDIDNASRHVDIPAAGENRPLVRWRTEKRPEREPMRTEN